MGPITEPGVLVETLVKALLCGERPLYRMQEFWSREGFSSYLEELSLSLSRLNDDATISTSASSIWTRPPFPSPTAPW